MRHNICGTKYKVKPSNFVNGRRCPVCKESEGEREIRYWLTDNNIDFKTQFTFDDLLSDLGNLLRFDFAIFENNKKIKYLIEYDGKQHYEWIKNWQTEEEFHKLQYHDRLKNNYCIKNNIQLIRIPYWEFDLIENILNELQIKNN